MDKWIYIVSWTLASISFSGEQIVTSHRFYNKDFKNKEKAIEFYNTSLKDKSSLVPNELNPSDYLIFVEIDSTKNKQRK